MTVARLPGPGRLAQLGERQLDKLEVTGSSPVTPISPRIPKRGRSRPVLIGGLDTVLQCAAVAPLTGSRLGPGADRLKIVEQIDVVNAGTFGASLQWKEAAAEVEAAVAACDWPVGSGKFTINPQKHGNGVKAIKDPCIGHLSQLGWMAESLPPLPNDATLKTGDLDALLDTPRGFIGFEWETGNISSSHRAINKLVMGLMNRTLVGGFLTVPSDALYPYLTDRIGNIKELRPYLPLWANVRITEGVLRIVVVEHDDLDANVPLMVKGTDGRALR